MKRLVSVFAALAAAMVLGVVFAGCTSAPVTAEYLSKYPLGNRSEVIETELDADELFTSMRSWIIDNYKNAVSNQRAVMDKTMISLPIVYRFNTDIGLGTSVTADMNYTLVIEFREGRMRVQLVDLSATPKVVTNGGNATAVNWGALSSTTVLRGSASQEEQIRAATAENFRIIWENLLVSMHKIADGTMEGLDW